MLRNVMKHHGGSFSAVDESGRRVFITESISFIFEVTVNTEMNTVSYRPVNYKDVKLLTQIDRYLRGQRYNKDVVDRLVIRFGWMDRRLNKLSFMSLTELMSKVRSNEADASQERKVQELCKQLSLSLKAILK